MFKNLSGAYLWLKVRPVLMNGKIGLTGSLYFILATKNVWENVSIGFRGSLLRFILFLGCECLSRVMVFIVFCTLFSLSTFC